MLSPREADYVLSELCREFGFCLPAHAQHAISDHPPSDPHTFARAVFTAEGVDPDSDSRLYGEVYRMVSAAFDRAAHDA